MRSGKLGHKTRDWGKRRKRLSTRLATVLKHTRLTRWNSDTENLQPGPVSNHTLTSAPHNRVQSGLPLCENNNNTLVPPPFTPTLTKFPSSTIPPWLHVHQLSPVPQRLHSPLLAHHTSPGFCPHWSGVVGPNHHSAFFTTTLAIFTTTHGK